VALICDTGPLYAAMDRSEEDHELCASFLEAAKETLLVPAGVLVEVDWFARRRLGHLAFLRLLSDIEAGAVQVIDAAPDDYARIRELMDRYSDLPLGFVDASVVAIAERLGEPKVATLDRRYFGAVRPRHVPALRIVP
jgi:uncharacterized protein